MACPDETTVERFLAGDLDETALREVRSHLADCTPCCQLVGALMSTSSKEITSGDRTVPRLSRYRIHEPLGVGGMGIVYCAYDPELDRRVALKVLWSAQHDGGGRLQREARAMAKLAHPNVVRVFDVGIEEGRVFLAMELVEGGTMRSWMKEGPHPWPAVLARFRQAGAGLAAAHRAGLIHRDFKPENLLLRSDGTVLVTDFGLAHEVPFGEAASTRETSGAPGTAGTPAYMAPEQLRGESLDARVDVHAFSVSVWEALYGVRPPDPESPAERDRVPERVRRALERGFAPQRRDRTASLEALLAELDVEPTKQGAPSWTRSAAIVALVAAVLVIGVVVGRSSAPATPSPSPSSSGETSISPPAVAATGRGSEPAAASAPPPAITPSVTPSVSLSAASPSRSTPPIPRTSASISAAPVPRGKRPSVLRATDFMPYGRAALGALEVVRAHVSDFDPCWTDECFTVTCRFQVDDAARITGATCFAPEGQPACPSTPTCLAQRIRALHLPAPEQAGECSLFFDR